MKNKLLLLIVVVFAFPLMLLALTQLRGVAIFNSTIDSSVIGGTGPAAGTFTTMRVNTGLNGDGGGMKHKRFTSCTTASGAGAFCQTNFTWNTPFADANYTMVCGVQSGTLFIGAINNKTAAGAAIITELTPGNSTAASTELDCFGFHD